MMRRGLGRRIARSAVHGAAVHGLRSGRRAAGFPSRGLHGAMFGSIQVIVVGGLEAEADNGQEGEHGEQRETESHAGGVWLVSFHGNSFQV